MISKLKSMFTGLKAKAKEPARHRDQLPPAAQTPSGRQALESAGVESQVTPELADGKDQGAQAKELRLTQRVSRVAESILENERLTADLDDEAAKALLDWGIACAEMIARNTAGLDDAEAEEVMSPRLRATRRLMRLVNKWGASRQEMDTEASAASLTKIIEQAAFIYGKDFAPPDDDQRDAFLRQHLGGSPLSMIVNLRTFIENSGDN